MHDCVNCSVFFVKSIKGLILGYFHSAGIAGARILTPPHPTPKKTIKKQNKTNKRTYEQTVNFKLINSNHLIKYEEAMDTVEDKKVLGAVFHI